MDLNKFPRAPKRDFSINYITDRIVFNIMELSEVGTDFRKVSVEVAKEILKRFGE